MKRIVNKEVKIKKIDNLTSEYVDNTLKEYGFDVVRWVIIDTTDEKLIVSASVLELKKPGGTKGGFSIEQIFKKIFKREESK